MSEGEKHTVQEVIKALIGAGESPDTFKPDSSQLTNWVEWVLVHKGCKKQVMGLSDLCRCLASTGMPPDVKQIMGWCLEDCEAYAAGHKAGLATQKLEPTVDDTKAKLEAEIVKLTEKLDKASKRIAELTKSR